MAGAEWVVEEWKVMRPERPWRQAVQSLAGLYKNSDLGSEREMQSLNFGAQDRCDSTLVETGSLWLQCGEWPVGG